MYLWFQTNFLWGLFYFWEYSHFWPEWDTTGAKVWQNVSIVLNFQCHLILVYIDNTTILDVFLIKGRLHLQKVHFSSSARPRFTFSKSRPASKLVWWYFEWICSAAQNDGWLCAQLSWAPHIVEEIWHLMWPLSCNAFLFKTHSHTINTSWP